MKRLVSSLALLVFGVSASAWAQTPPSKLGPDDDAQAQAVAQAETPPPPSQPAPNAPPPMAPPGDPGAPDANAYAAQQPAPTPPPPAPEGQWFYTQQYGWVWQPYAQTYTRVAPDASVAWVYVYRPAFGWRWVGAPWVVGWGPRPWFGAYGPRHYVWYSRPWFARPYYGRHYVYGGPVYRVHPAYPVYRRGFGGGWHHRH